MIPIETQLTFFLASVLLALAPGPDNIFVLTQSALHGRASGIAVVFGLCTGIIVHTTLVAFGVAIIFKTSAVAFGLLKFVGAGYLVYLAIQAFRASPSEINGNSQGQNHLGKLYRRGIIMNVTNPKVTIFFLAFLPQFADPLRGPISIQILYLGGLFIVSTIWIFGAIALLAGTLGQWLKQSPRTQLILNKCAGSVFLALALKLVTTSR